MRRPKPRCRRTCGWPTTVWKSMLIHESSMKIARRIEEAAGFAPSAVTIGNFDGVHLGHQHLFEEAVRAASEARARPTVLTFDPHPARVVAPDRAPGLLTPIEERCRLIEQYGIAQVLILPFDETLARRSPEEFVREILVQTLGTKIVLVGENFRFGHKQSGDTRLPDAEASLRAVRRGGSRPRDRIQAGGSHAEPPRLRRGASQARRLHHQHRGRGFFAPVAVDHQYRLSADLRRRFRTEHRDVSPGSAGRPAAGKDPGGVSAPRARGKKVRKPGGSEVAGAARREPRPILFPPDPGVKG